MRKYHEIDQSRSVIKSIDLLNEGELDALEFNERMKSNFIENMICSIIRIDK